MFEKICILIVANLLFFYKSLQYKYSSDDIPVFTHPPKTKNFYHKLYLWIESSYRAGPQVDHALTMFIHTLNSVLIYIGFGANDTSFIAALLFMVNPLNNQGSIWISGRSYALATLGLLGAMAFPYISFLFLIVATYYNAGFLAPVMFACFNPWILVASVPGWAINFKRFSTNVNHKIKKEMFVEDRAIKPEKFVLAIKTFGYYTSLALFPFRITFYHAFLQSCAGSGKERAYSVKDKYFWLGLAYVVGIITYFILVPWNLVSFGLLWWCVCLAPFCNLFRMSQEIAERYAYLPMPGLMFVLASLLTQWPILIAFVLGFYAAKLWNYMDSYVDDYTLVESACLYSPKSWFAWHIRAMSRWERKSFQEAVIIWTMARMISPNEFKINFNIATALRLSKNDKEAEAFISIAEKCIPAGQEEETTKLLAEWKKGNLSILL